MELKKLITDDSAVSPVIGVILMVAITVLLAATAASFFLGLAGNNSSTPQAAFNFDYDSGDNHNDDRLKISHAGGDTVEADTIAITVSDVTTSSPAGVITTRAEWNKLTPSSAEQISAGMTVNISKYSLSYKKIPGQNLRSNDFSLKHTSVEVVWNDPDNAKSFTLAEWKSPTA